MERDDSLREKYPASSDDETYRRAFVAWLRGQGPPPEKGEPPVNSNVGPNQALYEIVMEQRRAWASRPHTYTQTLEDWDEARLWAELDIEIEGLVSFLTQGMVDPDPARVAAVGIMTIVSELRSRRRQEV